MLSYLKSFVSSDNKGDNLKERMAAQTDLKKEKPALAKHDSSVLDLAFVMDCTSSMGSYIESARNNIRKISEDIVAHEKSNVQLALVEYRDHPPQDSSFVTRPHDFTSKIGKMKSWLDDCSASGGGDGPEAVADGLHQLLKLSWREEATKIAVLISDAPPHGLGGSGDGFPKGCPDGLDPMVITSSLAENGVTLYVVGCEPSITPYKDFFVGLAYMTGGQYVPLAAAKSLTQVIIGGAQEEISLEQWMEDVQSAVDAEVDARGAANFDHDAMSRRLVDEFSSKGARSKHLTRNAEGLGSELSPQAKKLSGMKCMADVRSASIAAEGGHGGGILSSLFGGLSRSAAPTSAHAEDLYACVDSDIKLEQAERMVQKAKMRSSKFS